MSLAKSLAPFEVRWARDAFEAVYPGPDGIGPLDIEGYLAELMRAIPLEPALGLRAAIWIVALAPLLVLGRFATIHGLSAEDREEVVVRLASNRVYAIRQLVLLLKTMGALLYAGDRRVRERLLASHDASPATSLRGKTSLPLAPAQDHEPAHDQKRATHVVRVA